LISFVSLSLQDREGFPEALCVGNEFVEKVQKLAAHFENNNMTTIELVREVARNVHELPREVLNCDRPYIRSKSYLNKVGYILMNRSPCERDIGLTLIILDRFVKNVTNITETLANSVGVIVNSGHTWTSCANEIDTLLQIWSPKQSNSSEVNETDTQCLVHGILEDVTTLLKEGEAFLRNPILILNKIGIEVFSTFIQCEKKKVLTRSTELSILEKVAWSFMHRSKCERSMATALVLIDRVLFEKDASAKQRLINLVLSADSLFNDYLNCANEITMIKDIITKDE